MEVSFPLGFWRWRERETGALFRGFCTSDFTVDGHGCRAPRCQGDARISRMIRWFRVGRDYRMALRRIMVYLNVIWVKVEVVLAIVIYRMFKFSFFFKMNENCIRSITNFFVKKRDTFVIL